MYGGSESPFGGPSEITSLEMTIDIGCGVPLGRDWMRNLNKRNEEGD